MGLRRRHLGAGALCLLLVAARSQARQALAWADAPAQVSERPHEILEVYLDVEQALRLCFPAADRFETQMTRLNEEQAARVAKLADHPLDNAAFTIHTALAEDVVDGYAVVTEEIGRFHDITFLVGVNPDGTVRRVEVLVYRESRGGEIRHRRFLHQYEGKSLRDPIRLNRDMLNITGATLSVRAMSRGVRKVLGVLREAQRIP